MSNETDRTPSQLELLVQPFHPYYIHRNPSGGGDYVSHPVIVQRILQAVGPFDFKVTEVIRGDLPAVVPNPEGSSKRAKAGSPALTGVVVGVIGRLGVTIDGRYVEAEDAGDCEDPHNWPHDGARLKDAISDAIKRCAARIGVGLHLWAGNEWFLDRALAAGKTADPETGEVESPGEEE